MRSPAAAIGLIALLICIGVWVAGAGGSAPQTDEGPTRWIVVGILVAVAVAAIAGMLWDSGGEHPASGRHRADAEAAAAAHADRRESRRSQMAEERIARLAKLLDQGAITPEEFADKKAEILRDL